MADILSQEEINELLAALASGQDEPKKEEERPNDEDVNVRPYDFRKANKFSKEQIRMLNVIFGNFAGRLSTFLSGTLRSGVDVDVASVEEQTFAEYNNSIPTPAFLAVFEMPPLAGLALLEFSATVCYEIISCLFGGKGQAESDISPAFTEIEIAILNRVVNQMLGILDESFQRIVEVRASLDRIETSSQFAQIVAGNEPTVIITMNVKVGEVADVVNICIPHLAIQPIAKALAQTMWYDDGSSKLKVYDDISAASLSPGISSTQLMLKAVFDMSDATIKDVINLLPGDVIRLEHPTSRDLTVMVEHIPKFRGALGVKGKYMAIRVTEILKEAANNE